MEPMFFPGQLFNEGYERLVIHSVTLFQNSAGDIRELIVARNEDDNSFSSYVYNWEFGNTELYSDEFDNDRIAFTETRDWLQDASFVRLNV